MGLHYVDAYWPAVILIVALFTDLAQQPSVSYLLGVSKHRYLAIQTLIEGVASPDLILSMFWARQYGMVGVAMGTLVPMVVAKLFLQPAYVCRHAGISLRETTLRSSENGYWFRHRWGLQCGGVFRNIDLVNLWRVVVVVILQATLCAVASFFLIFEREDRHRLLSKLRYQGEKGRRPHCLPRRSLPN